MAYTKATSDLLPTIPSRTSQLTNDSGFLTGLPAHSHSEYAPTNHTHNYADPGHTHTQYAPSNHSHPEIAGVPAGMINAFANETPPNGWLECNGQTVSTSTYSALFAAIGYKFGGSGSTFVVPDLRGEFIRGWDHGRGIDAGRVFGTFQTGTLTAIDCESTPGSIPLGIGVYDSSKKSGSATGSTSSAGADSYEVNKNLYVGIKDSGYPSAATLSTYPRPYLTNGNGDALFGVTRPRNVALMYCIKT